MFSRVLHSALAADPRSALVIGPRQTGKSTLLRSLGPHRTLNLADPATFRTYVAHPERLRAEMEAAPPTVRTVLLDEVQRIPALLDVVQILLDERPGRFRFLLSGSSARKLRRGQANLLPGRVHAWSMHPLLACELGDAFDLDSVLACGSLPGIQAESDPVLRARDLRSYADTYLREEIQAEALVRDLGGYARLLDLVAAGSGQVVNLKALCTHAGIAYETARRYVEILVDTLVLVPVPAWAGSDRARLVAHPRLFLFDLGVRNALLRRPLDAPLPDERGLLLEHLVASELWRRQGALWPEARLSHFRTRDGAEVDLVLEVGREVWAIEVKSGRHVDLGRLAGMRALEARVGKLARKIIVYLGDHRQRHEDVEILPLAEFLAELPAG